MLGRDGSHLVHAICSPDDVEEQGCNVPPGPTGYLGETNPCPISMWTRRNEGEHKHKHMQEFKTKRTSLTQPDVSWPRVADGSIWHHRRPACEIFVTDGPRATVQSFPRLASRLDPCWTRHDAAEACCSADAPDLHSALAMSSHQSLPPASLPDKPRPGVDGFRAAQPGPDRPSSSMSSSEHDPRSTSATARPTP
ncbi:uncharacterized protein MAM_06412 [Metarhizium album ARSEF 1941]|uniref:Uncharacterized protein n=1 Tax=Metarhizium album (strain ARSEF 1941) TaxID=1081103 RepID=A0A0B2WS76_METAS|nr:uncharacterized protein MAM_06412 [Metarhizium album ARSEF 1941]KHN95800.1 hypothetical protein MAM_06412 [Metarhizium album ARSEF 1941]